MSAHTAWQRNRVADSDQALIGIGPKGIVEAIRHAFVSLSRGGVEMPPILGLKVPQYHGEVDVKTAFMPDIPHIAVKISPGFFENPKIGLPRSSTTISPFKLGDILRGVAPGRVTDADITVCDLTGTGVQDTVIADLALRRAQAAMVGTTIDTEKAI